VDGSSTATPGAGTPAEVVQFRRSPAYLGVELIDVAHSARRWSHLNGAFAFGTMWDWHGRIEYRRRRYDLPRGNMLTFDPNEFFDSQAFEGRAGSFGVIEVSPAKFEALCRAEGARGPIHFGAPVATPSAELTRALSGLRSAVVRGTDTLEQQSWLAAVTHAAVATALERGTRVVGTFSPLGPCERLRDLLHSSESSTINLCDFAEQAGVSQFQLLRAFKKRYGSPPHAYRLHARILRARQMLHAGFTVAEAAAANDFTDQSHFTRHFRRIWGITPGRYATLPR
jgi:AraC-like DNA-binding protein